MADPWEPDRYQRFAAERRQPVLDLLARCRPINGGTAVDLGCGTGEMTAELHRALGAARTVGIDNSPAMLARAEAHAGDGVDFELGDLSAWAGPPVDVIFSNAALHWVPDHGQLLARLRRQLCSRGQLAFGIPANFAHPSHTVARQVAAEPPFAEALGGVAPGDQGEAVLSAGRYAEILFGLGALEQSVEVKVYGHVLDSSDEVVAWVRSTLLTPVRARLDDDMFHAYLERFAQALRQVLGDQRPYFYAFPRLLAWARF